MKVQTLKRVELSQAVNTILKGQIPPILQDPPEVTEATDIYHDMVTVMAAVALGWPVLNVKPVAQVGRFVLTEYTPIGRADPDMILCMASGREVENFHKCMGVFQKKRRHNGIDPGTWFDLHGKPALKFLASALWLLDPSPMEANFVLRWAALVICNYRLIYD